MKRAIVWLATACILAGGLWAAGSGGGSASTVTTTNPVTAQDWYTQGYTAADKLHWTEAMAAFKKAIALKSDYAEAYNMLGYATRKSGNPAGAFAYYDKALQLKPNFPEAREYYGEAYLESGDLAKAVQQYVILQKSGSKEAAELLEKIGDWVNKK